MVVHILAHNHEEILKKVKSELPEDELICDLAEKGKSIIMVSSELPELLGVCDRICVMSGGRLVGEVSAADATQERIMELASENV